MFLSGILARGRTRVKESRRWPALRWMWWLPAAGWMAGIFYLSHQPAPLGRSANAAESFGAHVVLYTGLALLLVSALAGSVPRPARAPRWLLAALAFAVAVLYGVSDEVHQTFVAGRSASDVDLGFDAFGAFLGVALALLVDRIRSRRGQRANLRARFHP